MVSCVVLRLSLLINGKDCLKYIQTALHLPFTVTRMISSKNGIVVDVYIFIVTTHVKFKKVSDKHRISKLCVLLKASIKGTLIKS